MTTIPPNVGNFNPLSSPAIQPYEKYIPTAFNSELTMLQKVNYLLNYMQTMTDSYNNIGTTWSDVVAWVTGDGLTQAVDDQLQTWQTDGTLATVMDNFSTKVLTQVNSEGVNVLYPPAPLVALKGDGVTDDSANLQALLNYCSTNNLDLILDGSAHSYKLNSGITWNYMHHSIKSYGNVILDFSGMSSGNAITVMGDPSSNGTMWQSMTHELRGFKALGNSSLTFLSISETASGGTSDPCVNVENVYMETFKTAINLGSENWCHSFNRLFFRNVTNAIVINTNTDAGENIQFTKCIFSGGLDYVVLHQSGTVEVTFEGCSFDYNKGVLKIIDAGSRGTFRFNNSHFEDDGTVTEFLISKTGSENYYVKLQACDWYFTGTLPTYIADLSGDKINMSVVDCIFPLYTTSQDRSYSDLFYIRSGSSRVKIKRNQVETGTNNYYQTFSRSASHFPVFSSTNLSNGVFGTNGGGSLVTDPSYPSNGLSTLTYKITGALDVWSGCLYDGQSKLSVAGWLNRSSANYSVQARYYDIEGNLIQTDSISIPGSIGSWVKFGQQVTPPINTYKVRLQVMGNATAGSSDTFYMNDWIIEQI